MAIWIDTSEVHDLAADIIRKSTTVELDTEAEVARGGARMAVTARATVRSRSYETGDLYSSITTEIDGLSVEVRAGTDHAIFLEEGTSRMAAEPFMGPAFDQHIGPTIDELADVAADIWGP